MAFRIGFYPHHNLDRIDKYGFIQEYISCLSSKCITLFPRYFLTGGKSSTFTSLSWKSTSWGATWSPATHRADIEEVDLDKNLHEFLYILLLIFPWHLGEISAASTSTITACTAVCTSSPLRIVPMDAVNSAIVAGEEEEEEEVSFIYLLLRLSPKLDA